MASHKFTAILHMEMLAEDGTTGDNSDYQKELAVEYVSTIIDELNDKFGDKVKLSQPKGAVQEMLDIAVD